VSLCIILRQEQFLKHVHNTFGFGWVHVCTKKLYIEKLSICHCDQSMGYQQSLKSNKKKKKICNKHHFFKNRIHIFNFVIFSLDL
jgi:hypothetical protein